MQIIRKCKKRDSRFQIPDSGYTLIEILVGLTIIALLFSLGYVNFRDFSRRQEVADTAKALQGDISLTQQLALSGQKPDDPACNSPHLLNSYDFVVGPMQYKIVADCTNGTVVNKAVSVPSDLTLSSDSLTTISFKVLGQGTNIPINGGVTLTLSQAHTTNIYKVMIGPGGNIQ